MGKKMRGENSKVTAAKEKKKGVQDERNAMKAEADEKIAAADWATGSNFRKAGKAAAAEEKRAAMLKKKADKAALEAADEADIGKMKISAAKKKKSKKKEDDLPAELLAAMAASGSKKKKKKGTKKPAGAMKTAQAEATKKVVNRTQEETREVSAPEPSPATVADADADAVEETDAPSGKLVVLALCNRIAGSEMVDLLAHVRSQSRSIGTHKRRELYWQAFTAFGSLANGFLDETMSGFMTFHLPGGGGDELSAKDGKAKFLPATKRQRGLLGSVDIMGKKFKSLDPDSDGWFSCWFDEDAQMAYDDIMHGEPVVYLSQDMDGVFIGTRLKRKKCKGAPSKPLQKPAGVHALKATLLPGDPLQSISWHGNDPVELTKYNFVLSGTFKKTVLEDKTIVHVPTASADDIYAEFESQRNEYYLAEAEKLIGMMMTDIDKGEKHPICNVSMKLASVARQNGLMKKVYVHASKKNFINAVTTDAAGVELYVIQHAKDDTQFMSMGGVVFELHYRSDLEIFI